MRLVAALAICLAVLSAPRAAHPARPDAAALAAALPPPADGADEDRAYEELIARRPRGEEEAVALLHDWVARPALSEAQEHQLQLLLQALRRNEEAERLVARSLADAKAPPAGRLRLLRVLARSWVEPPASWVQALGRALEDDDPDVRLEAVFTVRARDRSDFDAPLLALARQAALPDRLRVAALEAVTPRQRPSADDFALLTEHLSRDADPLLRRTAGRALGAARLDNRQLTRLAAELPGLGPTPGALVLPAFARSRDAAVGQALVKGLKGAPALRLLGAGDLDRLLSYYPAAVIEAARPVRDELLARDRRPRERVARVAAALPPGDAGHGREVFFSAKAACSHCHRAEGKGGTVGPNLSRIGVIRGRPELLESIVWPSAYIGPEFRAWVVATADGGVATGLLVQEADDAVYLRAGPAAPRRIPRDQVEDVALSPTSLMPEGFDQVLGAQELSDLVEFLAQLR